MVFEFVLVTKARLAFCMIGAGGVFVAIMLPPQPARANHRQAAATQLNQLPSIGFSQAIETPLCSINSEARTYSPQIRCE
jgi:hypothetical protein